MAKVIMNSQEYINRLKYLADRPSYYSNTWPNNLCYVHKDGRVSADCWNLIKAILNGYDVTNHKVGYYQHNLSNTGDCTGEKLLAQCSYVSSDFKKLKNGEPRILYMASSPHSGSFIGEITINGKLYNVIECTGSWEHKILYSWVDSDGTRRHWKGGTKNGKWTKHGLMTPWVKYENIPSPAPTPDTKDLYAKALEVKAGKYGNNPQRREKFKAEGFTESEINQIQSIVNELCNEKQIGTYYVVKKGDTLTAIAKKYNTTPEMIKALNPGLIKNINFIKTGWKVRVK